jgi:anti-sigma B factor antagonist
MQLDKRIQGDVTVVTLDGTLDSSTAQAVQADLDQILPDDGKILLDLGKISYMSSAGLRVLLVAYRRAQATGARIALARLPADIREVMTATGFLDFFGVSDTVEEGVEALAWA